MRNILSYEAGTKFTGKEIIEWSEYQIQNNTSHVKYAKIILCRFKNLNPDKLYSVKTNYRGSGCGEIKKMPRIEK